MNIKTSEPALDPLDADNFAPGTKGRCVCGCWAIVRHHRAGSPHLWHHLEISTAGYRIVHLRCDAHDCDVVSIVPGSIMPPGRLPWNVGRRGKARAQQEDKQVIQHEV